MLTNNRPITTLYRLLLFILSTFALAMSFHALGLSAFFSFSTWALFLAHAYLATSALVTAFAPRRDPDHPICPMLQGTLLTALVVSSLTALIYHLLNLPHPTLTGWAGILTYIILPILVALDYLIFSAPGAFRPIDPFYYLAFPATYISILVAISFIAPTLLGDYPLAFPDPSGNLAPFFLWATIYAVLILAFGYLLWVIDALRSGFIAKHIIMLHFKTVDQPA